MADSDTYVALTPKTRGAWVVHHTNKIELHGDPSGLDAIRRAGNCGMLLSSLAASDEHTLTNQQVETLATVLQIDKTYQLPSLLNTLHQHQLIDRSASGLSVLGFTTPSLLEHTDRIYASGNPTLVEQATVEMAELCSQEPRSEKNLSQYLGDQYKLAQADLKRLMGVTETLGLCDTERLDAQERLFFNGNLFRQKESVKAKKVLDTLTATDRVAVTELDARLRREGCVAKVDAKKRLGDVLFSKLSAIGFYDVSTVSNDAENVEFIMRPSAFNKFGRADVSDSFDLAKALIASLQYGMSRSSTGRGRIFMLERLMSKLITGASIGPCTAIGQDYRVLELRGVVRVSPTNDGMYTMRLLKRDIGELALQVLQLGDASERSLMVLPGSPVSEFTGPEVNRTIARSDGRRRSLDVRKALDVLRTGGL